MGNLLLAHLAEAGIRLRRSSSPAHPFRHMERPTAQEFDQELLYLYDYYAHGHIDRRTFLERAAKFAVGGLTAVALLEMRTKRR